MRVLALAISAILIVQTGVILSPLIGVETGGWYWPFLDYPMYSKTHFEGEAVKVRDQIAVILSDGTEHDVELDDVDLNFWFFQVLAIRLVSNDPRGANQLVERHPRGDEIREIVVYQYPVSVTKDGPAVHPRAKLKTIRLDSRSQ